MYSPEDAWFDGSAVLYYGLVLVELVRSEGGSLPLRLNFAWKGSADTVPTIFGVVSRQSFRIPRCVASGRQRFDNLCCFE